jgi:hypothetical protein
MTLWVFARMWQSLMFVLACLSLFVTRQAKKSSVYVAEILADSVEQERSRANKTSSSGYQLSANSPVCAHKGFAPVDDDALPQPPFPSRSRMMQWYEWLLPDSPANRSWMILPALNLIGCVLIVILSLTGTLEEWEERTEHCVWTESDSIGIFRSPLCTHCLRASIQIP